MIERDEHRLARARLADDAERPAALERERDAVDARARCRGRCSKRRLQVVDLEQRHRRRCGGKRSASRATDAGCRSHARASRTSKWARSASPRIVEREHGEEDDDRRARRRCAARSDEVVARPSTMMLPHDRRRRPRRRRRGWPSVPSATMTTAMPSSAIENIAGSTFGSTSRNMMRQCFAPCASGREHELALRPRRAWSRG